MVLLRGATLLLLACLASASSPPKPRELDLSYTFSDYCAHFSKTYDDADDYKRRREIFEIKLDKILSHNLGRIDATTGLVESGYVMGVNAFTDAEDREIPKGYNKLQNPAWSERLGLEEATGPRTAVGRRRTLGGSETTSYRLPADTDIEKVEDLPVSVDWTDEVNAATSQGGCGSCWAYAAVATVESRLAIETGVALPVLDHRFVIDCTPNPDLCGGSGGCDGATAELAYNYIADRTTKNQGGLFPVSEDSVDSETCEARKGDNAGTVGIEGYVQLPTNNYEMVMNAIQTGPLAIAVASSNWDAYHDGVLDDSFSDNRTHTSINHLVTLVGYDTDDRTDEDYWLVRNSWGASWGEGGYIRLKRTPEDGSNCGMDTEPLVGTACELDDEGNSIDAAASVKICGTSGMLFDVSFPVGPHEC